MQQTLFDTAASYGVDCESGNPLFVRDAMGQFVPASDKDVLVVARELADRLLPKKESLNSPQRVKDFFRLRLNASLEHEVFGMVLLNSQYELIEYQEPFRGTLTQASVYPREIVKMALAANAAAIIMAHNHPSGALIPSEADKSLTRHLKNALALVDVQIVDHIIVADSKTYSFAEHGIL